MREKIKKTKKFVGWYFFKSQENANGVDLDNVYNSKLNPSPKEVTHDSLP